MIGEAMIIILGVMTAEGVECPAVRADDGTLYTLVGQMPTVAPGARLRIEGEAVPVSKCMQGITLRVKNLEIVSDN